MLTSKGEPTTLQPTTKGEPSTCEKREEETEEKTVDDTRESKTTLLWFVVALVVVSANAPERVEIFSTVAKIRRVLSDAKHNVPNKTVKIARHINMLCDIPIERNLLYPRRMKNS